MIESNFTIVQGAYLESIFSIISILPKCCSTAKVDPVQVVNIFTVLDYLFNNIQSQKQYPNLMAKLISRWFALLPSTSHAKLVEIIVQILQAQIDIRSSY